VPQIGIEAIFLKQFLFERIQRNLVQVHYLPAALADEMMVMSFLGCMITDITFPKVGLSNQIKLLQQFQCAIDSGYVGIGITPVKLLIQFFGADMSVRIVKHLDDQHPLGGQAVPLFAKNFVAAHFKFAIPCSPLK